ncbi:MAG: M48 family metallopeptidase [Bacteroidales bacterium]
MNILLLFILVILAVGFLIDLILDLFNLRRISPELPLEMEGRYDAGRYAQSQVYLREKTRFGLVVGAISTGVIIIAFLTGLFTWIDHLAWSISPHPVVASLIYFGLIGLAADLLGTPFTAYATFVIEQKYGFNTTTLRTFVLDKLKSWLLALLIGAPVLALITWLYTLLGGWFWLAAWVTVTVFSLLMTFFYSSLIVPLFNKQTPLEEGSLREAIRRLSKEAGFVADKVFVIDGSRRSNKSNAYFTGFGKRRRIVLYDTLIRDLDQEGVVAVLAHEIGHYRRKHVIKGIVASTLQTGAILFLFSLLVDQPLLATALNLAEPNFHTGMLVFGVLFSPVSLLLGILFNHFSRKQEFEADAFAAGLGLGQSLGIALITLAEKNLGNLTPHPAYVVVHYSHPPFLKRLERLNMLTEKYETIESGS